MLNSEPEQIMQIILTDNIRKSRTLALIAFDAAGIDRSRLHYVGITESRNWGESHPFARFIVDVTDEECEAINKALDEAPDPYGIVGSIETY